MASGVGDRLILWGGISLNPAASPTVNWAFGCFSSTAPTRNGAGDYSFTLATGFDLDSNEVGEINAQQKEAAAASSVTSYGWVDTSDTSKRLTILREAGSGAASALTDITGPVILTVYKRVTQT